MTNRFNRALSFGRQNPLRLLAASGVLIVVLSAAFPPDGAATVKLKQPSGSDRTIGLTPVAGRPESMAGAMATTTVKGADEGKINIAKPALAENTLETARVTDNSELPAAMTNPTTPADIVVSEKSSIDMSAVQRIRIRASSAPELSGEYIINGEAISVPSIGRFSIRGLRLTDLESLISRRLTRSLHRDIQVSVEIERYLPFYIVGRVATAGEQEWRQGMTLIQALATSGGVLSTNGGAMSDGIDADQIRLRFALAQLERLKAERDGNTEMKPSIQLLRLERAAAGGSAWSAAEFTAIQNKLLEQQQASVRTQIESLTRERNAAIAEEEAGMKQVTAVEEQLTIAREIVKSSSKLHDKQLVANNQFLTQKMQSLTAEVNLSEARTTVGKVRARIAALERLIATLPQERKALLNDRIETLEREIAETQMAMGGSGMGAGTGQKSLNFAIARKSDRGTSTVAADLFTEIAPGDVVIVSDATTFTLDKPETAAALPGIDPDSPAAVLQRTQRFIEASRVPATNSNSHKGDPQRRPPTR